MNTRESSTAFISERPPLTERVLNEQQESRNESQATSKLNPMQEKMQGSESSSDASENESPLPGVLSDLSENLDTVDPNEGLSPLQSCTQFVDPLTQDEFSFPYQPKSPEALANGSLDYMTDFRSRNLARRSRDVSAFRRWRSTVSDGKPASERSASPLRAASVEVLAASREIEDRSCADGTLSTNLFRTPSPSPSGYMQSNQELDLPVYQTSEPESAVFCQPIASSSVRSSEDRPASSDMRPASCAPAHMSCETDCGPVSLIDSDPVTRDVGDRGSEIDILPDISYERSFLPPNTQPKSAATCPQAILEPLQEHEDVSSSGVRIISEPIEQHGASCVDQKREALPATPSADQVPYVALETICDHAVEPESPATNSKGTPLARPQDQYTWETPAATKQYMNEIPTRTAITRRVESFQVPPERLATLQPEIASMQKKARRPTEKLSLKESSAQIDALLNENWGLKMKIMFMDQHFEHDRDKANLIAENVRLQTNGYNFVQQVKSRDKTIRHLEKRITDMEFAMTSQASKEVSNNENDSRVVAGHESGFCMKCSNALNSDAFENIQRLENDLEDATVRLKVAEQQIVELDRLLVMRETGTNEYHIEVEHENAELRQSLAEAEEELLQHRLDSDARLEDMSHVIELKTEQVRELREKLTETYGNLQRCEVELDDSDRLSQIAIQEIRDVYENERLEYEMYIEDRHEEIDNLKQALKNCQQESFDTRLLEATRPQEEAWRELNQQYNDLAEELAQSKLACEESRIAIEQYAAAASSQEQTLARECERLTQQVMDVEVMLRTATMECSELQRRVVSMEDGHNYGTDTNKNSRGCEDEVGILQAQVLALDNAKGVAVTEAQSHFAQWQLAKAANDSLSLEFHELQQHNTQLRTDLQAALVEVGHLYAQIKENTKHICSRCQQYQDDIAQLHGELDEQKHSYELLQKEMEGSQLPPQVELLSSMNGNAQALRLELDDAAQIIDTMTKEIDEAKCYLVDITNDDFSKSDALVTLLTRLVAMQNSVVETHEEAVKTSRAAQELAVDELRLKNSILEQNDATLKMLRRSLHEADRVRSSDETRLRTLEATNAQANSDLREARCQLDRIGSDTASLVDLTRSLLTAMLMKINSVLSEDRKLKKRPSTQDFAALRLATQDAFKLLWQQLDMDALERASVEAALRKELTMAEKRLAQESQSHEKLRLRLLEVETQSKPLHNTPQMSERSGSPPRSGSRGYHELRQDDCHQVEHSTRALTAQTSHAPKDENWVLHERIKVLNRELKYQRELREQDDKAAKLRLTESKTENRDLRRLIDSKRGAASLLVMTNGHGDENLNRTRASDSV